MDNCNSEFSKMPPGMPDLGQCMMLVLIVDQNKTEAASELLQQVGIMRSTAILAEGSAKRGWLEMLGLWSSEKTVLLGVVRQALVYATFKLLHDEFCLLHKGTGIAFTIPLLAHTGFKSLFRLHEKLHDKIPNMPEDVRHQMKSQMKEKILAIKEISEMDPQCIEEVKQNIDPEPHVLIIAIVNRGFSGEVIDSAREAGAQGATTLHGRGLGARDVEKFLNIRVEPEKEIVLVVVKKEIAKPVMKKISEATNLHTKAHGVCFALPVDEVFGLTPIEDMFNK